MLKYLLIIVLLFQIEFNYSQGNQESFFYKPFSIYKSFDQIIIAGDVNTFIYHGYYGKDVISEHYIDPHSKPEYLIYEFFKAMKIQDINSIDKLYDTSFKRKNFEPGRMANMLKNYTDIKFISKFRTGDQLVIRYNFISSSKQYAYFAVIKKTDNSYYLSSDFNISDPFNIIGSLSPNNLFERKESDIRIDNMTPFYFISKNNKVFYSEQLPVDAYSALYMAFEFYSSGASNRESMFLKELQNAATSPDSLILKNMLSKDQLTLLSDSYFSNYYYSEIKKIFSRYSNIIPVAAIKTNEGKILYFNYSMNGQSPNIASIILKDSGNKYYLSLRITNDDLNNILQNVYVREAILNYLEKRKG